MSRYITAVGILAGLPEYRETSSGKLAVCAVTVTTKRRDPMTDEWVDDPPVTYQLIVTDEPSLAALVTLTGGERVLFSGTVLNEAEFPQVEAESVMPADQRR